MAKSYPKLSKILKQLLFQKDMRAVELARELDIPQPTIHRLVTGKSTRPYKKSLEPIADYFAISVDQLLGEKPLVEEVSAGNDNALVQSHIRMIAKLSWDQIETLDESITTAKKNIIVGVDLTDKAFALEMPDSSMEPLFPKNSLLIFEPMIKPRDRSYVLVKLHDTPIPVFRQLLIDVEYHYLKPLNPDLSQFKMRIVNEEDSILACLVESRLSYEQ